MELFITTFEIGLIVGSMLVLTGLACFYIIESAKNKKRADGLELENASLKKSKERQYKEITELWNMLDRANDREERRAKENEKLKEELNESVDSNYNLSQMVKEKDEKIAWLNKYKNSSLTAITWLKNRNEDQAKQIEMLKQDINEFSSLLTDNLNSIKEIAKHIIWEDENFDSYNLSELLEKIKSKFIVLKKQISELKNNKQEKIINRQWKRIRALEQVIRRRDKRINNLLNKQK